MASAYAKKLAGTAEGQYDKYHLFSENDNPLAKQIASYWQDLKFKFPGVSTPWSAVFVSWCVKEAGAVKAEFNFNAAHSQYVFTAIQNAVAGTGVFRALPIADYGPQIGDIIQNNRGGNSFDYQFAKTHKSYASHCAIVIEIGTDSKGGYALTVGGNESDSVRKKIVRLNNKGLVKQRPLSPYICVIQNLK
jgi:hypothetical protein